MRTTYLVIALIVLIIGSSMPASAQSYKYQITPYLWLSGIDGDVGALNRTVNVDASPRNILDHLDLAGMGAFEARLGKWRILTDVLYVDVSDQPGNPFPLLTTTVGAKTFIFDQEGGYQLLKREGTDLDATAGIRYWNLKNQLRFAGPAGNSLTLKDSQGWVDPVVGLRFNSDLPWNLFVTAKGDIGGFSTAARLDWQAFGTVGYRFSDLVVAGIGYRNLSVDYKNDGFVFDTGMRGAFLALGFRF